MTLVRDILKKIDQMAPFSSAMSFDNSGLLVGNALQEVKKVLLALDITSEAVKKAKEIEAQLILSHHPVIFDPLKSLSSDHPVYHMAKWDIAAICAHTNLDVAEKGAFCFGRKRISYCFAGGFGNCVDLGRIGFLHKKEVRLPGSSVYRGKG